MEDSLRASGRLDPADLIPQLSLNQLILFLGANSYTTSYTRTRKSLFCASHRLHQSFARSGSPTLGSCVYRITSH